MSESILDYLEDQIKGHIPYLDIIDKVPGITIDESYKLMLDLAKRKEKNGDKLIGYKAAYTSKAMQKQNGMDEPIIGCLMRSGLYNDGELIQLKKNIPTIAEPEITVMLGKTLTGPNVNTFIASSAIEGLFPSIEFADWSIGGKGRSRQMGIATHKSTGGFIIGGPMFSPKGLDMRLEGAVIRINGEPRGSGTGVEVLGDPINVIVEVANMLARYDKTIEAGMIIMTGSIVQAVPISSGDEVEVQFTRLGTVRSKFL